MPGKTGWVEKRQFERIVATLKVDYHMVDSKDSKKVLEHTHYKLTKAEHLPELSKKSPLYHAVTKDISMGGLSLLGPNPFERRWDERSTAPGSKPWRSIRAIWTVSKSI